MVRFGPSPARIIVQHAVLRELPAAVFAMASDIVYVSGIAEIGLGGLLLFEQWSVVAGGGLIALLIAVCPANNHLARAFRTVHVCIAVDSLAPLSTSIRANRLGLLVHAAWFVKGLIVNRYSV